ncbi:MAG: GyrI-like domain-containing protein [Planctomycetota bacterium]|nr:GyrI-like domain-containing protein [Planctomycetota bacterium]
MSNQSTFNIEEKTLDPMLIAGIRMKGRYSDCGKAFAKLCRAFGRYISGKPFLLHYDSEYKETDADFEPAFPLRQSKQADGVSTRTLPGGCAVSLIHQGPYDQLGRSYARILDYIKQKNYSILCPTREIYLKGPGMIFKGNPKNYLTEIQMLIA